MKAFLPLVKFAFSGGKEYTCVRPTILLPDYEDFGDYDAVNRTSSASVPLKPTETTYIACRVGRTGNIADGFYRKALHYRPLHPPVIVSHTWRDA